MVRIMILKDQKNARKTEKSVLLTVRP